MNLVADECVDHPIVEALRIAGHNVAAVAEFSAGISDDEVLALAQERSALLVTQDTDFGELVFRLGQASSGVLLVRLEGATATVKAERVVGRLSGMVRSYRGLFPFLTHHSFV